MASFTLQGQSWRLMIQTVWCSKLKTFTIWDFIGSLFTSDLYIWISNWEIYPVISCLGSRIIFDILHCGLLFLLSDMLWGTFHDPTLKFTVIFFTPACYSIVTVYSPLDLSPVDGAFCGFPFFIFAHDSSVNILLLTSLCVRRDIAGSEYNAVRY